MLIKTAFDKEDDGEIIVTDRPSPRPKDAATLILIRRDRSAPEILMGKRSGKHSFMPDKYVFPGGRVDPHDGRVPILSHLSPHVTASLCIQSRRKPASFALTAIRETYEETGLIVGKSGSPGQRKLPSDWQEYYDHGVMPCLKNLEFIGRAVTPPYRPKRFDARFFMANASDALIDDRPPVDGAELSDLQWVRLSDAADLDLPSVTQFMLDEIETRVTKPESNHKAPFLRWSRGGTKIDRI